MTSVEITSLRTRRRTARRRVLTALSSRGEAIVGLGILLVFVVASVIVPILSPYSQDALVAAPNLAPSAAHPFGTDALGRDLLVRCAGALHTDLTIIVLAVGISLVVGQGIGMLIGLARNRVVDLVATRLIDAVLAIPFVILVLTLTVVIGNGPDIPGLPRGVPTILLSIWTVGWAVYARLGRAETLSVRNREYIVAASLLGYSRRRVFFRHMLPNVTGASLTYVAADAVFVMVTTASLAFLGTGVQEPTPELGSLMYQARDTLQTAWWAALLPGAIIVLVGLGFSLVADSFATESDVRR
ncbi:ABC transporter permease [Amycolatopsis sp. GM8]|uniref:ABC transporter permease n=1 Tax=Amycolatopsis sp. GM8 TaxID=2896530 RepID=UPI001F2CA3EC|nr:ABC transporter permease [Amycolatopsis sp. GM8]